MIQSIWLPVKEWTKPGPHSLLPVIGAAHGAAIPFQPSYYCIDPVISLHFWGGLLALQGCTVTAVKPDHPPALAEYPWHRCCKIALGNEEMS
jgi:hypothetical protein